MDVQGTFATLGYARARPATAPSQETPQGANPAQRLFSSFADALTNGEQTAQAAMAGRADPHALVTALAQSELAVEAAVTLRDKVVEAYQEILRMPV